MKTLGVAMATFNGLKHLPAQLESIVNQTLKPAVISISDDGSTDGTRDYLKTFAEQSSIPVVLNFNSRNVGVIDNFMMAFEKCDSDYIAYCDQDDVWHPERLGRVAAILEKTDAALVFHRSEIVTRTCNQTVPVIRTISAEEPTPSPIFRTISGAMVTRWFSRGRS